MAQLNVKPTEPDAQSVNLISFESTEQLSKQNQQTINNQAAQAQPPPSQDQDFIFEDFARMRHLQTQSSQDELK